VLLRDFITDEQTGIAVPPDKVSPAGCLARAERYPFERRP